ncbi:hypothetical protein [Amycolatopsis sp. CA-230715]|uniref:hypothetical protein n=1 Tax=Amycolatopsis sp. CA-230715 TaxID=2745196 RepID=UPI001C32D29C|nr:hypothetical protein [Amycolatopsis sp. CA-230715]QWF77872.1 hypothetical protein HUW46_01265 [Amycolatopsis sp. CA-230715]
MTVRTTLPAVTARQPKAKSFAVVLPAALLGLAACGSAADPPGPATGSVPPSASGAPTPSAPANGAPTYQAAVERWVTQVLRKQYAKACLSGGPVLPADRDPETLCKSPQAIKAAKSLRDAWAKPGVKLPPEGKVAVTDTGAAGDQVAVADTAVELDGRTLRSLELVGASGNTGSFSLTFKVRKHEGAWYVESFELKA